MFRKSIVLSLMCVSVVMSQPVTNVFDSCNNLADAKIAYQQRVSDIDKWFISVQNNAGIQYLRLLKDAELSYQKEGNLDVVILLKKEQDRFFFDNSVLDSNEGIIPAIADARTKYNKYMKEQSIVKNQKLAYIGSLYRQRLEILKVNLTKIGNLDGALAIKSELDSSNMVQSSNSIWKKIGKDDFGVWAENELGMRFRWCPAGSFVMGSPENELGHQKNETQKLVKIANGFWISDSEVTQGQWESVMGSNPSKHKGKDFPVEMISSNNCFDFLKKMNGDKTTFLYKLPAEIQWEYACRSNTKTSLYNNKTLSNIDGRLVGLEKLGWYKDNSGGITHSVRQLIPNSWGIFDMYGNVWEWCENSYIEYSNGRIENLHNKTVSMILRGGAFTGISSDLRSSKRHSVVSGIYDTVGFRIIRQQN